MAHYDNLPVYKATYDLLLALYQSSQNLKREFRYTIGEKLKSEVTEVVILVYRANSTREKMELINKARMSIEIIRLNFRLLYDLKQLSLKQYVRFSDMTENISKQLAAWQKYAENNKSRG